MALAILPSKESNHGSPKPTSRFVIPTSILPPIESPSLATFSITFKKSSSLPSTSGIFLPSKESISSLTSANFLSSKYPHLTMCEPILIPYLSKALLTIADKATKGAVSLPEK